MIWRVYYEKRGHHVHCRVFAGLGLTLAKCGDLCMRAEEFTDLTRARGSLNMEFIRERSAGKQRGDDDVVFARVSA